LVSSTETPVACKERERETDRDRERESSQHLLGFDATAYCGHG